MGRTAGDICSMSILYVDDDLDISKMVCRMLSKNYPTQKIYSADNGLDALNMIEDVDPDILLVDVIMPIISGVDLVKRILDRKKHKAIIIVSVVTDIQTIIASYEAGCSHYVTKPINFEDLFSKIDSIMYKIFCNRIRIRKMASRHADTVLH